MTTREHRAFPDDGRAQVFSTPVERAYHEIHDPKTSMRILRDIASRLSKEQAKRMYDSIESLAARIGNLGNCAASSDESMLVKSNLNEMGQTIEQITEERKRYDY